MADLWSSGSGLSVEEQARLLGLPPADQGVISDALSAVKAAPPAAPVPVSAPVVSPYQDYTGGYGSVPSVSSYGSGNTPPQWSSLYGAIQSGQAKIGTVYDMAGNATPGIFDKNGNQLEASVTEVSPNVYKIGTSSGQYNANFVVSADPTTNYVAPIQDMSKQYQSWRSDYSGGGLAGALESIDPTVLALAISFAAPGIGSAIAAELAVSDAVGTAIANAAMNIAAGADPSTAIQNAVTNAVVQTGSSGIATEINTALSNLSPETAASISNAAGSAISSAAKTAIAGGSTQDIINNAVAGAAGSAVSSETGDKVLGAATTGGLTGGLEGALTGAAGAYLKLPDVVDAEPVPVDQIAATDTFTPDTAAQTGGVEPVSRPPEAVSAPVEGVTEPSEQVAVTPTPVEPETLTPPAPQEIPIPDQITREQGGEQVTFAPGDGDYVGEFTITAPRDEGLPTGGDTFVPEIVSPVDKQILDLTGSYPEPAMPPGPATTETAATQPAATEEIAPAPYKPEFFVAGGVAPRMQTGTQTLAQTLQSPFYGAMPTTGLTSYRGAGEIESSETGGKRRNVWNEASLRLKDALGI